MKRTENRMNEVQPSVFRIVKFIKNIPIENVSAAFHYVADNETVRVADILNEKELVDLISKIPIEI